MRNMIGLYIRASQHKNTPVCINMVYSTLWIIFCNHHQHVLPIRCPGKKMQDPSNSKVVVSHVTVCVGVAILRSWRCRMIVGNLNSNQGWHFLFSLQPHFGEFILKLVHPELIGNIGIVPSIIVTGSLESCILHGYHYTVCCTCSRIHPFFADMGRFIGLTKIIK